MKGMKCPSCQKGRIFYYEPTEVQFDVNDDGYVEPTRTIVTYNGGFEEYGTAECNYCSTRYPVDVTHFKVLVHEGGG